MVRKAHPKIGSLHRRDACATKQYRGLGGSFEGRAGELLSPALPSTNYPSSTIPAYPTKESPGMTS